MIREIHTLLSQLPHYAESDTIDFAKGKHELRSDVKGIWEQEKRKLKWQLKR